MGTHGRFALPDCSSWVVPIRGQLVMLEADLALACGILPQRLAEKVKLRRQISEPGEIFQLTVNEKAECVATHERLRRLKFSVALPYAYSEAAALRVAQLLNTSCMPERVAGVARAFAQARERQAHWPLSGQV
jgi:hypothetical protein